MSAPRDPLEGRSQGPLGNLRRRIYLTYTHFGLRTLVFRALTLPLRFTPLERRMRLRTHARDQDLRRAREWYREHGRPVDVVIPSYRDATHVARLVRSIRKTRPAAGVRVIVADDCSGPEHLAALREIGDIDVVVESERNGGFAANANRGIAASDPERDVVVLNSDMEALPGWLECLQYGAHVFEGGAGIVGAQLQYPDGRIQFGGTIRNRDQPQWFDHRYRFKPFDWGPAGVPSPALAVTGACMYLRRDALVRLGAFDEIYPMAYEDVDLCLRAWLAGEHVLYFPCAQLVHHEAQTRGTDLGVRERESQRRFWGRWARFFDDRAVGVEEPASGIGEAASGVEEPASGRGEAAVANRPLRIVYVTEDTGVGGGHRDVFEHLNRLAARGHDVCLYTLGDPPDWFPLQVAVRSFEDYRALGDALAEQEAIKVATWWMTAGAVWRASIPRGLPVYFVQDIETSYYPDHERARQAVLDSYRPEFRYMTISSWNRERLRELDLDAELIPPGIDLETFRPREEVRRRGDMVLALGRTNPLKNLPLTLAAWRSLAPARPELCLFGIEPELGGEGIRYVNSPSDEQVGQLFCEATVFIQTSTHEGFALPPLEAMACGTPVVCTNANGNQDFCVDGVNCLMPPPTPRSVGEALAKLLSDTELRASLAREGIRTAQQYAWERRIDALEDFFRAVAGGRRMALGGEPAVPTDPRRCGAPRG